MINRILAATVISEFDEGFHARLTDLIESGPRSLLQHLRPALGPR